MTKQDYLQNMYITEEGNTGFTIVLNDMNNHCFIEYKTLLTHHVRRVFFSANPTWIEVRSLVRLIREYGIRTNTLRAPWRYPVARHDLT